MGALFEPFDGQACCLCGARGDLTGEHKIKASLLREIFGSNRMVIGGGESDGYRSAQGPKSDAFHFAAPLCKPCNDTRTQAADRAFVQLHRQASAAAATDEPLDGLLARADAVGEGIVRDAHRYFAKLMCCHVASSGGPRPVRLAAFALGESDGDPLTLLIDRDWTYAQWTELSGEHQYAAHGGLSVFCDKNSGHPNAFHSTLTAGPVRYTFEFQLNGFERVALVAFHHRFAADCRRAFETARASPVSEADLLRLNIRQHAESDAI